MGSREYSNQLNLITSRFVLLAIFFKFSDFSMSHIGVAYILLAVMSKIKCEWYSTTWYSVKIFFLRFPTKIYYIRIF